MTMPLIVTGHYIYYIHVVVPSYILGKYNNNSAFEDAPQKYIKFCVSIEQITGTWYQLHRMHEVVSEVAPPLPVLM